MSVFEMFIAVILLTLLLLIAFAVGLYVGIKLGDRLGDKTDKASANAETAPQTLATKSVSNEELEERKRLIEDQKAFRQMMDYSAVQAYGGGAASNSEAGDS